MKCVLAALCALTLASVAHAGLYTPEEPTKFTIRPDGTAEELSWLSCKDLFVENLNVANPTIPESRTVNEQEVPTHRGLVLRRIRELQPRVKSLPPGELARLAANLLRAGKANEALTLLAPHARGRAPDFRIVANFVHILATNGEWDTAMNAATDLMDLDFPNDLAGTTAEQRKWLTKVERQYYLKWLRLHRDRVNRKLAPDVEDVLPLFDAKFVNDAGQYEPGKLAASERAKLPPDAVAIVQQLILWAPWDISLQWLLGELYAANGQLKDARDVFERCGEAGQYSNRKLFMAHRAIVREAAAKSNEQTPENMVLADTPTPDSPKPNDDFLPSRERVIVFAAIFGVIALALIALQLRSIGRRLASRSP